MGEGTVGHIYHARVGDTVTCPKKNTACSRGFEPASVRVVTDALVNLVTPSPENNHIIYRLIVLHIFTVDEGKGEVIKQIKN